MGFWSGKDMRCKKHPRYKQSNGVCPSCLRDRLSTLSFVFPYSSESTMRTVDCSSNVSTPYSSDSISSSSSSTSLASPVCFDVDRKAVVKSRSLVEVGRERGMRRRRGFWSKLLMRSTNNGRKGIEWD